MRSYELSMVLNPILQEKEANLLLNDVITSVLNVSSEKNNKSNNSLENITFLGRRKLAFILKKHTEGIYMIANISVTSASLVEKIKERLKMDENFLRLKVFKKNLNTID